MDLVTRTKDSSQNHEVHSSTPPATPPQHNSPRQSRDLHEDDAMTNVVRMPTLVSCDKDGGCGDLGFLASSIECTRAVR